MHKLVIVILCSCKLYLIFMCGSEINQNENENENEKNASKTLVFVTVRPGNLVPVDLCTHPFVIPIVWDDQRDLTYG